MIHSSYPQWRQPSRDAKSCVSQAKHSYTRMQWYAVNKCIPCSGDARFCVSTGSCRHDGNAVLASHPDAERMCARAIFLCRSVTGERHRRRGSLRDGECPFPHVAVIPP